MAGKKRGNRSARGGTQRKSAKGRSSPVATGTFLFANPKPSPDDFNSLNPGDVFADSSVKASTNLQKVPRPRQPATLELARVLGGDVDAIASAGGITFHAVGDTGGVKQPSSQFAVADAMTADRMAKTYQTGLPAFFYHLGDVVYYFGQERYYYDQFYDPYRDYNAPIFAIPGNHDGVVSPSLKVKTLQGFLENFCTTTPSHNPEAQGNQRTTLIEPGAYFTLNAPFVRIIGLYSNTSEGATEGVISGGVVGTAQLTFLQQQLTAAAAERATPNRRALIIAVHHPPFTGSADHAPSPTMLTQIDAACAAAKVLPDLVLSGHAHIYERYTRVKNGQQIPYVVAGTGGYFNLSSFKRDATGALPKPGVVATDGQGNELTLETFKEGTFGFLRLTVSARQITGVFLGVDVNTKAATAEDSFTVDLTRHTVT